MTIVDDLMNKFKPKKGLSKKKIKELDDIKEKFGTSASITSVVVLALLEQAETFSEKTSLLTALTLSSIKVGIDSTKKGKNGKSNL